jgi:hypothetical protein
MKFKTPGAAETFGAPIVRENSRRHVRRRSTARRLAGAPLGNGPGTNGKTDSKNKELVRVLAAEIGLTAKDFA